MIRGAFVVLLVAVSACGHKHAQSDGSGGKDTAGCKTDDQCTAGSKCCSAVCVETADCAFAPLSVDHPNGFVNGGDYLTLNGAGFATGMKVWIGDGRAPALVISATEARVLTPPGPVGLDDIKIELNGATATLHGAYSYRTAGLENTWEQKPLQLVRGEDPALAVMQDGRVLIAGGTTVPDDSSMAVNTAEIYTRSTDTVTPVASTMGSVRWHDAAIPLLDGKVLVVGGTCGGCANDAGTSADLFDPATNTFTPTTHPLNHPRYYVRAVLMVDGRVFISSAGDPTIEIYDPTTQTFTLVDHTQIHTYGFVVRLRDGRVLLGAGDATTRAAEVFDFDLGTTGPTATPLVEGRAMLIAHTLPSGQVLIVGGANSSAGGIIDPTSSIELFDPATNSFALAPYALATPRTWHAGALVRDGTVLVMGGYTAHASCDSSVASVEQVDPVAGTVKVFSPLPNTNTEWTAVALLDGSVLGVGGGACGTTMALPDIDFLAGAPIEKTAQ
jgi:hypothetical protein